MYGVKDDRYASGPLFGSCYSVVQPGAINVGDQIYIRE